MQQYIWALKIDAENDQYSRVNVQREAVAYTWHEYQMNLLAWCSTALHKVWS